MSDENNIFKIIVFQLSFQWKVMFYQLSLHYVLRDLNGKSGWEEAWPSSSLLHCTMCQISENLSCLYILINFQSISNIFLFNLKNDIPRRTMRSILFFFGFPNLHDSCRCIYMKYLHDSCRKKKEGCRKILTQSWIYQAKSSKSDLSAA